MSFAPATQDTSKGKVKLWRGLLEWICRAKKELILV